MRYIAIFVSILLSGCVGVPEGIEPVRGFDAKRYLGTWYEIARLDHSFEQDLQAVTAEYSPREDGGISVINRGFNVSSKTWSEAEGKAYFVEDENTGHLKVSFFGPFYGSYIVFSLGENYEYSLVTSSEKSYLWLLSRTPTINKALQKRLVAHMAEMGFDTDTLIFVEHNKNVTSNTDFKGSANE